MAVDLGRSVSAKSKLGNTMIISVNVPKLTGAEVLYQLIVGCVQCKHGEGLQYLIDGHTRAET